MSHQDWLSLDSNTPEIPRQDCEAEIRPDKRCPWWQAISPKVAGSALGATERHPWLPSAEMKSAGAEESGRFSDLPADAKLLIAQVREGHICPFPHLMPDTHSLYIHLPLSETMPSISMLPSNFQHQLLRS